MNAKSDTEYLLEEARKLYESGMHEKLADKALDTEDYKLENLKKMVEIALVCTQSSASSRPTMSEVLLMLLSNVGLEGRTPNRPTSFNSLSRSIADNSLVSNGSTPSNATASFTQFTGR